VNVPSSLFRVISGTAKPMRSGPMRKQVVVRFLNETEGALRYREVNSAGAYTHDDREESSLGDIHVRRRRCQTNTLNKLESQLNIEAASVGGSFPVLVFPKCRLAQAMTDIDVNVALGVFERRDR
jgi:hypothetical protein